MRSRDYVVHMFRGDRYTIEDATGRTIAEGLTKVAFRERFPELFSDTVGLMDTDQRRERPSRQRRQRRRRVP